MVDKNNVCTVLVGNNGNVKEPRRDNCFPLFNAEQNCHADLCAVLTSNNANVYVQMENGARPLF